MAALTDNAGTYITPAVVTSSDATKHMDNVVKPAVSNALTGMATQSVNNTATKQNDDQIQAGIDAAKIQADKIQSEINANNATTTAAGGTTTPSSTSTTTTPSSTTTPTAPSADQTALTQAEAEYQQQAKSVQDTIKRIQNGSIPLNSGEQAQVASLQAQFGDLIANQKLANTGASGLANIRGYQTGSAEYDPSFQVKTIGAIVTAGNQKVSDLMVKEAGAVSDLTQSIKNNDIAAVKDAWDVYQAASKARTDALQKTISDTQAAIKAAQDAKQKIQDNVDALAEEAAKNGAPADVITKITSAATTADAIASSMDYLSDPTTLGGQYAQYVRMAKAQGQTPISAAAFIQKQKYNEAYASAKGAADAKATPSDGGMDFKSLSAAAQASLKANGFTNFNSGTQDLAVQLVNGQIAPSELSKRTTGTSSYNDVLTAANKYSQATTGKAFNIAQADRDYKFATNTNTQSTLNYLGSLVGTDDGTGKLVGGNLNELIELSQERATGFDASKWGHGFAPSSLPDVNNLQQWVKIETGDPAMAAYHATLLEVSDQVAKVLQGGGSGSGTSDAKLKQAQELFKAGFTPDQMVAVATSLKGLLSNRATSMVKDNPYLSDYATQFGVQTKNGVTTTNQQIIQDENTASSKIGAFYHQSPENAKIIDDIHSQFPDIPASEVAKQLGL